MAPGAFAVAGSTPRIPLPVPYSAGWAGCSMRAVVFGQTFGASLTTSLRSAVAGAGAAGAVGAGATGAAGTAAGARICGGPAQATFTGAARTTHVFTFTRCSGAGDPGRAATRRALFQPLGPRR